MSWKVKCPHCGEPYNINEEHFGKKYRCMMCSEPFTMPTAEELRQANIIRCPVCLAAVAPTADICPKCGGKMPVKIGCLKSVCLAIIAFFGAVFIVGGIWELIYSGGFGAGLGFVALGSLFFFGAMAIRRQR